MNIEKWRQANIIRMTDGASFLVNGDTLKRRRFAYCKLS